MARFCASGRQSASLGECSGFICWLLPARSDLTVKCENRLPPVAHFASLDLLEGYQPAPLEARGAYAGDGMDVGAWIFCVGTLDATDAKWWLHAASLLRHK